MSKEGTELMPIHEVGEIITRIIEDDEYNLKRAKSPKMIRQIKASLKYHKSIKHYLKVTVLLLFVSLSSVSQTPFKNFNKLDDGTKHMVVSTCLSWPLSIVAYKITDRPVISTLLGFVGSLTLGIVGKELIYDKWMGRGQFSGKDITADAWGSVVGSMAAGMNIGLKIREIDIQEDYFHDLNVPSTFVPDSLILDPICLSSDTILITNKNN